MELGPGCLNSLNTQHHDEYDVQFFSCIRDEESIFLENIRIPYYIDSMENLQSTWKELDIMHMQLRYWKWLRNNNNPYRDVKYVLI